MSLPMAPSATATCLAFHTCSSSTRDHAAGSPQQRRHGWSGQVASSQHHPARRRDESSYRPSWKEDLWRQNGFLLRSSLFLCCLCLYWNSLDCGFVFDDRAAIEENRDLRPHSPWTSLLSHDFWGTPMRAESSHKSFRPLTVASFRLNYGLGRLEPSGYHLVNVILHGCVTLLYLHACQKVAKTATKVSYTAAGLFAVHPIHTEAVTGIVGRAELLSCLFFLLALISHDRVLRLSRNSLSSSRSCSFYLFGTLLATLLATLSKEQGITALAVCMLREVISLQTQQQVHQPSPKRRNQRTTPPHLASLFRLCFLGLGALALLFCRLRVMGPGLPAFNRFDNPASAASAPTRLLTWAYLPWLNFWLLLNPSRLCCDWTRGSIPLVESILDPRNGINLVVALSCFLAVLKTAFHSKRKKEGESFLLKEEITPEAYSSSSPKRGGMKKSIFFSRHLIRVLVALSLLIFPFLPASNLFFPVGFVVAERVLYLPSLGFCLLVAMGYHRMREFLANQSRRHKERRRKQDEGEDEKALSSPQSTKMIIRRNFFFSPLLLQAWSLLLPLMVALHGLKVVTRNLDWSDELSLFRSGLSVTQDNAKLFHNVGRALHSRQKSEEAITYFRRAIDLQQDDIGNYLGLGQVLEHLGREHEAERVYREGKGHLFNILVASSSSVLTANTSNSDSAEARVPPSYLNVVLNLALLVSKNDSRVHESLHLYDQVIEMRPDFSTAHLQLGALLHKVNRTEEAVRVYVQAVKTESGARNADLLYNLAVLLRSEGRQQESREWLEKLLVFEPEHEPALLMLAADLGALKTLPTTSASSSTTDRDERLFQHLLSMGGKIRAGESTLESVEKVHFHLGMMYADRDEPAVAESWLQQAVDVKPTFAPALFNLALLLSQQERWSETKTLLSQLLRHHPEHIKGWLLLGDLYVSSRTERDLPSAEYCYRTILKLRPAHAQAMHNLCVVMVEAGDLEGASQCLEDAEMLAPEAEYIRENRKVVQGKLKELRAGG